MASIRELFDHLVEAKTGTRITVEVTDRYEYETIRTRLSKLWSDRREVIVAVSPDDSDPAIGWRLCSDYIGPDHENGRFKCEGVYYLAVPRKKEVRNFSFTIVQPVE